MYRVSWARAPFAITVSSMLPFNGMRYDKEAILKRDALAISCGETVPQRQDSLDDQLKDLYALAVRFGLYDAADFMREASKTSRPRLEMALEAAVTLALTRWNVDQEIGSSTGLTGWVKEFVRDELTKS